MTSDSQSESGGVVSSTALLDPPRVVCRFSCGAASAVATKLAIAKYGTVEIYYNNPGSEHADNVRFIQDCEKWFGQKVNILKSEKYSNVDEVFEARRFLVSNRGAPCTSEMKRIPGDSVWTFGCVEIYGYTVEEKHRVAKWRENNFERTIECPLVDKELTKSDCFGMLARAGIELPAMYRLGFRNNNCIGCVKARDNLDYWKRVRLHFPEVFARRAKQERDFKVAINRRTRNGVRSEIYLDEIEPGEPKGADPQISCGLFCMAESDALDGGSNAKITDAAPAASSATGVTD